MSIGWGLVEGIGGNRAFFGFECGNTEWVKLGDSFGIVAFLDEYALKT